MDSIATVKIVVEATDERGVIRRAEFDSTAATNTRSGFTAAEALTRNLCDEVAREVYRATHGRASKFDAAPSRREDEPAPTPIEPDGFGVNNGPHLTGPVTFEFDGRRVAGLFVERGRFFPDMPPGLPDETDTQYTNRLTGYSGRALIPYDHRRFRECSIGFHDTCSQRATPSADRRCQCPCHADADTIATAAQRLGNAGRGTPDPEPASADGGIGDVIAARS
jgi:hypothetical protein